MIKQNEIRSSECTLIQPELRFLKFSNELMQTIAHPPIEFNWIALLNMMRYNLVPSTISRLHLSPSMKKMFVFFSPGKSFPYRCHIKLIISDYKITTKYFPFEHINHG